MATIPEALAIAFQHHQAGRLQAAEQLYRQILSVESQHADALHLLGVIAFQLGKHEVAVEYITRAIASNGEEATFYSNLGGAYHALQSPKDPGKLAEAVACYRRALELKPDYAEAQNNLGNALKDQGTLDEAILCYRRALDLRPDYADGHNNLGNVLKDQGKPDEAVACYRRALELRPDYADAHNNLGTVLRDNGNLDEAVACYRRALELKPDYAEAHNNLGNALKSQGKLQEALACYGKALELKPNFAGAHSNLLLTLHYCPGVTPAVLAEAHAGYDRLQAAPLGGAAAEQENLGDRRSAAPNERTGHGARRLRLGFVSRDLGRHPVGLFLVRVLENLNREEVETICYSDRVAKDDVTHRLQAAATRWRDVRRMHDQRLAELIREDRIDILFDLAGHTAHNRLLVFAQTGPDSDHLGGLRRDDRAENHGLPAG